MQSYLIFIFTLTLSMFVMEIVTQNEFKSNDYLIEFPRSQTPTTMTLSRQATKRNAIFLLIPIVEINSDFEKFIRRLDTLKNDDTSDIIFFHHSYPTNNDILTIRGWSPRTIDFVNIDAVFNRVDNNLDPYFTTPSWSKRKKWSYQNMIRFWFYDVFHFEILQNIEYFLRLDDDSELTKCDVNIFEAMKSKKAVYFRNHLDKELESQIVPKLSLLQSMMNQFIIDYHIVPYNQTNIKNAFFYTDSDNNDQKVFSVVSIYNNFEVSKMEFFQNPLVIKWSKVILESNNIYYYRWGDAVLRYLTLILFAKDEEVLCIDDYSGIIDYTH